MKDLNGRIRQDRTMESEFKTIARREPKNPAMAVSWASIGLGSGLTAVACLVLLLAALWLARAPKVAPNAGLLSNSGSVEGDGLTNHEPAANLQTTAGQTATVGGASEAAQPIQPKELVSPPQPTPEARRLVDRLIHLEPSGGSLTEEQAAAWKQNLQDLIVQGAAGAAAIREFLAQNTEYDFGPGAKDLLGYGTARTAMIGALGEIGGPEAVNAMTEVLQTIADPQEIALLAQSLEKLEPGQHRQEVLEAARQTLGMASTQRLQLPDAAPLFEVLQKYGGVAAIADLEKAASQWNYYGAIALAQLPDDAGIPTLIQLAQDPKTSGGVRDATLQMLAQVSDRSPEARATLLALVPLNQMSLFTWQLVASSLAGDQVGLLNSAFEDHQALAQMSGLRTVATSDNQNYFAVPANLTAEQANQRIALIDDLLSGVSDPPIKRLLQQSKAALSNRLSHMPLAASGQ
jgi:PBS lyase HEAT-like repeat-containing protein